jgi:DNA segregation ATPase FtsK/SpoIIIE-like protein
MTDQLPGYVYALINPAMPGLVKVGRTARDPQGRVNELSAPTGVPTPFELVFDILVADAAATEARLHESLTRSGYRVAENREFFQAPIYEVIRLMLQLRDSDTHTSVAGRPDQAEPLIQEAIPQGDPMVRDAALAVMEAGAGSTSVIQRVLRVGYARATALIAELQESGVLGPPDGSRPRAVLMTREQLDRVFPPT